jgi:hypothetical protein
MDEFLENRDQTIAGREQSLAALHQLPPSFGRSRAARDSVKLHDFGRRGRGGSRQKLGRGTPPMLKFQTRRAGHVAVAKM